MQVISLLLDKGAAIDAKDANDNTPFLEAVKFGSKEAAQFLLDRGADLHAVDLSFRNCIHLAVTYAHAQLDMLIMLLDKDDGKLIQMKNEDLKSPVHFAAAIGDKEVSDNFGEMYAFQEICTGESRK